MKELGILVGWPLRPKFIENSPDFKDIEWKDKLGAVKDKRINPLVISYMNQVSYHKLGLRSMVGHVVGAGQGGRRRRLPTRPVGQRVGQGSLVAGQTWVGATTLLRTEQMRFGRGERLVRLGAASVESSAHGSGGSRLLLGYAPENIINYANTCVFIP